MTKDINNRELKLIKEPDGNISYHLYTPSGMDEHTFKDLIEMNEIIFEAKEELKRLEKNTMTLYF